MSSCIAEPPRRRGWGGVRGTSTASAAKSQLGAMSHACVGMPDTAPRSALFAAESLKFFTDETAVPHINQHFRLGG